MAVSIYLVLCKTSIINSNYLLIIMYQYVLPTTQIHELLKLILNDLNLFLSP